VENFHKIHRCLAIRPITQPPHCPRRIRVNPIHKLHLSAALVDRGRIVSLIDTDGINPPPIMYELGIITDSFQYDKERVQNVETMAIQRDEI
jgi:hypothetical protein